MNLTRTQRPWLGSNCRAKAVRAKRDLGWVPTKGDEDFLKGVEEEAASILAGLPDKAAL